MVNALFLWTAALCFKQTEKSASRQVILQSFSYFWSLSISSASRSVWLLMVDARVLCWVIRWGVWGWVSLRWSLFTGDGPDKVMSWFFFIIYRGNMLMKKKANPCNYLFLDSCDCEDGSDPEFFSGTAQSVEPWVHKQMPLPAFSCCSLTGWRVWALWHFS